MIIVSFVMALLYGATITVLQYGHLVGPAWRMEAEVRRPVLLTQRQYRQLHVARAELYQAPPVALRLAA